MGGPAVFLDACVLFPPLVRRIVLGAAAAGLFRAFWSPRVLDEWQIAAARRGGAGVEDAVIAARAAMARDFPDALLAPDAADEAALDLPDPADAHVVAAARGTDLILTFNLRDFPRRALAGMGLEARHPDSFLWELWSHAPEPVEAAVRAALDAEGVEWERCRAALKRARLPRLGKALEGT